jgi:putative transposase
MPRVGRITPDGAVHHVLNRGNARATLFANSYDYEHFLNLMADAQQRVPMRVLAFCLMRNHWHLVLWPDKGRDLSAYMRWLTNAHVRHHHRKHGTTGQGHVYQGRYKNFIVQSNHHLLTVLRYVESNAYRATLVPKAEEWRWSSAARIAAPDGRILVSAWPVPKPTNWISFLNEKPVAEQLIQVRCSVRRGAPFGDDGWVRTTASQGGLRQTIQPRGRPREWDRHLFSDFEKR